MRSSKRSSWPTSFSAGNSATFDAIVFDPAVKELSHDTIKARLREHGRMIPIVTLTTIEALPEALELALLARQN